MKNLMLSKQPLNLIWNPVKIGIELSQELKLCADLWIIISKKKKNIKSPHGLHLCKKFCSRSKVGKIIFCLNLLNGKLHSKNDSDQICRTLNFLQKGQKFFRSKVNKIRFLLFYLLYYKNFIKIMLIKFVGHTISFKNVESSCWSGLIKKICSRTEISFSPKSLKRYVFTEIILIKFVDFTISNKTWLISNL